MSQIDESAFSRNARRDWGWALFVAGLWCCVLAAFPLFWLMTENGPNDFTYCLAAGFFVLPYLTACFAFVHGVSAMSFIHIVRDWKVLRPPQRLGIIIFLLVAASIFAVCVYFVLSLDRQVVQYPE